MIFVVLVRVYNQLRQFLSDILIDHSLCEKNSNKSYFDLLVIIFIYNKHNLSVMCWKKSSLYKKFINFENNGVRTCKSKIIINGMANFHLFISGVIVWYDKK